MLNSRNRPSGRSTGDTSTDEALKQGAEKMKPKKQNIELIKFLKDGFYIIDVDESIKGRNEIAISRNDLNLIIRIKENGDCVVFHTGNPPD